MESGQRLTNLEVEVGAELAGETDHVLDAGHLGFEGGVAGQGAGEGIVTQVDRLGHLGGAQVAIDLFREERGERRGNLAETQKYGVQRFVGVSLVGVVLALPKTAAGAADIPVGEVVDKLHQGAHGLLQVVAVHGGDHFAGEPVEGRENPAVHQGTAA